MSEKSLREYTQIEEIAAAIKWEKLSAVKKQILQSKLAEMLLRKIHLGEFSQAADVHKNLCDAPGYSQYDGELFTAAFISSLKAFGKLDETTGKPIPFLKLFRSHYQVKSQGLFQRKKEENTHETAIKKAAISSWLHKTAKKHGSSAVGAVSQHVRNVLNYDKVRLFLQTIGASAQELADFDALWHTVYVSSDEIPNSDDGAAYTQSDTRSQDEYLQRERVLTGLIRRIERAFQFIRNEDLKKYTKIYISLKILEYLQEGSHCLELQDYVDPDFYQYYTALQAKGLQAERTDELLASFFHKAPDTIRKKRKQVEQFLIQVSSER